MTTTFNWKISQMDRLTADGFVVTVHYRVDATEGDLSAGTYGTVGFEQQPEETYTPFNELTEAQVVGWVQDKLGQATVEESLQSQIDALKAPVQESGLPWAEQAAA